MLLRDIDSVLDKAHILDGRSEALDDLSGDGPHEVQAEDALRRVAQRHRLQVAVLDVALRDEELRGLVVRVVYLQGVGAVPENENK